MGKGAVFSRQWVRILLRVILDTSFTLSELQFPPGKGRQSCPQLRTAVKL